MKKVVSVVLVALMVLVLSITAFADDTKFTVTTNVTEANRGDTVTLTVAGVGFTAKANSVSIMLTSVDENSLVLDGNGEWTDTSAPLKAGFDVKGVAVIANTGALELAGDVFSFNVKVKDDAPFGDAEVKLDVIVRADDGEATYQVVGTVTVVCAHVYGDWTSVDADDHERVCTICGEKDTAPHVWDDGVVTKEATHTEEGEKTYTCKDCGATKTEAIEKVAEHTFGEWKSVDAENHERVCACGEKETAPHVWDDGVVTVEPTATTAGEKVFTCKDCGATKSEVIPPNPPMGDSAVAIVFLSTLAIVAVCGVIVASKKRVNG